MTTEKFFSWIKKKGTTREIFTSFFITFFFYLIKGKKSHELTLTSRILSALVFKIYTIIIFLVFVVKIIFQLFKNYKKNTRTINLGAVVAYLVIFSLIVRKLISIKNYLVRWQKRSRSGGCFEIIDRDVKNGPIY